MTKLHNDQSGIAHLALIVVVMITLIAGAAGFAYTRIADKKADQAVSQEDAALDDESDIIEAESEGDESLEAEEDMDAEEVEAAAL